MTGFLLRVKLEDDGTSKLASDEGYVFVDLASGRRRAVVAASGRVGGSC